MRLISYEHQGRASVGALLDNDMLVGFAAADDKPYFASMQALIEGGDAALEHARSIVAAPPETACLSIADVKMLAPLPRPVRMRDCQLFLEHLEASAKIVAEMKAGNSDDLKGDYHVAPIIRERVIYYNCDLTGICGTGDTAVFPAETQWLDYELEWVCVIGKSGRDVPPEQAGDYIFGYTIFNDLSARDIQGLVMAGQIGPGAGKDFDNSNPMGPCITTKDEIADPYALEMTAHVNGEEWSRGNTRSMHHSFEDAIVGLSRDRRLYAGDIIASGTVLSGCGFELRRRLSPGDKVELSVDSIGTLTTLVRQTGDGL